MEFVRNLRERRSLTQAELASRIGCHWSTVSQIENGKILPGLELFAAMARALKVSPARLLNEVLTAYRFAHRTSASVTNLQSERERRRTPRNDH